MNVTGRSRWVPPATPAISAAAAGPSHAYNSWLMQPVTLDAPGLQLADIASAPICPSRARTRCLIRPRFWCSIPTRSNVALGVMA